VSPHSHDLPPAHDSPIYKQRSACLDVVAKFRSPQQASAHYMSPDVTTDFCDQLALPQLQELKRRCTHVLRPFLRHRLLHGTFGGHPWKPHHLNWNGCGCCWAV